ncbi:nucleoside phosphorylase [Roseivirga sp. BDSF3-8]|uniref:nucleoside phosphorylase n=1 Tax=Roseivirga sp. BDSF3-8 TaxID=3241598 RepID=UPI0035324B30
MLNQNLTQPIPESELILNDDGSVYHLNLKREHVGDIILTVGDPDRVEKVSQHFDSIDHKIQRREFKTHTGRLGNKRLSVISTGMGTDNVEILMTELDALVNIDLEKRTIKEDITKLEIIRLGTSGGLQPEVENGSCILSRYSVGLDTLMNFYELEQEPMETALATSLQETIGLGFLPYVVQASENLLARFQEVGEEGITLTAPGFYAPQGRAIRLLPFRNDLIDQYRDFRHQGIRISNFEMETAGYYALGQMFGHECLSCNAIIANRSENSFSTDPGKVVEEMIKKVLGIISRQA